MGLSQNCLPRLMAQVARRQQWAAFARRLREGLLGAGALYLVLLLAARLLALLPNGFTLASLGAIPAAALVYALIRWRSFSARETARLIDSRTGGKELFLTAALLGDGSGEFQPVLLEQAEARAAEVEPCKVLPFAWQRGTAEAVAAGAVLALAITLLPQLDPLGKEADRQKLAAERQQLQAAKELTAQRAEQLAEGTQEGKVERALDQLEKTLKGIKPENKEANLKRLAEEQKQLGELWREVKTGLNTEFSPEALAKSAQSFGQADPKASKQWAEELKKGDPKALKKELEALREEARKLAAESDPAQQRAGREQLQEKLNALAQGIQQELGAPSLNTALQRAMEQVDMAKNGDLSKEALEGAQQSLELSQEELEQLAQAVKQSEDLESALQNLQAAKQLAAQGKLDGSAMGEGTTVQDYAEMLAKLQAEAGEGAQPGEGSGQGMGPNPGQGSGGKAPENDLAETDFQKQKVSGKMVPGKTLLQWNDKGVGESGVRPEDYQEALREVKQRVSEAISTEQIPPAYQGAIQKYFDSMPGKEPGK